jgi:uncharacterized membrane protein YkvA (DUF1232 family)
MTKRPTIPPAQKTTTILEQITPEYVESCARRITHQDVEKLIPRLPEALEAFSNGALERHLRDAKLTAALLEGYWEGDYRDVSYWTIAVLTSAMAYVLKPIDIIPDRVPVIGQLDDAVIVALAFDLVRDDLDRYRGR